MTAPDETTRDEIHTIVSSLVDPGQEITDDTDLFEAGLDSMNTVGLILELESVFDCHFDRSDIRVEHFSSVRAIGQLVAQTRAGQQQRD